MGVVHAVTHYSRKLLVVSKTIPFIFWAAASALARYVRKAKSHAEKMELLGRGRQLLGDGGGGGAAVTK